MALPRALRAKPAVLAAAGAVLAAGAVVLAGRDGRADGDHRDDAPARSVLTLNGAGRTLPPEVGRELLARDPEASPNARAVQQLLADLEREARAGRSGGTVIGQHVEAHNELYNPEYGDYRGTKPVGYYYKKAADITGKLPGFVETDLGPGYGQSGWGSGTRAPTRRAGGRPARSAGSTPMTPST